MAGVEAATAQLDSLEFHGLGVQEVGGQGAQTPESIPHPEPTAQLAADREAPDTGQATPAQLPREQLPPPAPNPEQHHPTPLAEVVLGGNCVPGPGAPLLARTGESWETSDSDSDSDRSGRVPPGQSARVHRARVGGIPERRMDARVGRAGGWRETWGARVARELGPPLPASPQIAWGD